MKAVDLAGGDRRPGEAHPAEGGTPADRPARRLDFDVVIATRNRPQALALSIPLILGQSRKPRKLIVVDSSDDHAPVAETVAEAVAKAGAKTVAEAGAKAVAKAGAEVGSGWSGAVIVEHSRPGSAYQRNLGLAHVDSDVVIFPDDDSLFHPGTSEAMMRAYELDSEGRIAAVCAADALEPPPGVLAAAAYDMTAAHRRQARTTRYRRGLERLLGAPKPNLYIGTLLMARARPLDWFEAENCVLVEHMTGYRMSFRTECIRAQPFDETLTDYALSEDVDASFAAMRRGLVVGARNARIYHHKFPGGRGDPFVQGVIQVLNRGYVGLKHVHDAGLTPAEAQKARRLIRHFGRLSLLTCLPSLHKPSGRERLRGVLAAMEGVRAMLEAPREDLSRVYSETQARILARRAPSRPS